MYKVTEDTKLLRLRVWMARANDNNWLCWGNPNRGLTMHLGFPHDAQYLDGEDFIFRRTKREIESDISTWHDEIAKHDGKKLRKTDRGFCKPQLMIIEWTSRVFGVVK